MMRAARICTDEPAPWVGARAPHHERLCVVPDHAGDEPHVGLVNRMRALSVRGPVDSLQLAVELEVGRGAVPPQAAMVRARRASVVGCARALIGPAGLVVLGRG